MANSRDVSFMLKALALGEKARISAPPNPWVGCVLVKNDKIIGEGFSEPAGDRHAEVVAIANATESTIGATAYVTLEPCSHTGRTPPCTNALVKAGISRVVVAVTDPDVRVAGNGLAMLRQAGVDVMVGVCASEVEASLAPYLHQRKTLKPYNILKMALSVDGRCAASDGTSRWISSEQARENAHRLRAESQAILVGAGTAITDNPQLTVRLEDIYLPNPPLRVVVDSRGRLNTPSHLLDISKAPTLIATSDLCPLDVQKRWLDLGVEVAILPYHGKGIDLEALLQLLGKRGIIQLLTEGGSNLHSSLLQEGLCDRLIIYFGACVLGDRGKPAFDQLPIASMKETIRLKLIDIMQCGDSIRVDYTPISNDEV